MKLYVNLIWNEFKVPINYICKKWKINPGNKNEKVISCSIGV